MDQQTIEEKDWKPDPFNGLKVLKGEMEYYYEADPEIQRSEEKLVFVLNNFNSNPATLSASLSLAVTIITKMSFRLSVALMCLQISKPLISGSIKSRITRDIESSSSRNFIASLPSSALLIVNSFFLVFSADILAERRVCSAFATFLRVRARICLTDFLAFC